MIASFYPFEGSSVKETIKNIITDRLILKHYDVFAYYSQDFKFILEFMFEKVPTLRITGQ